MNILSNGLFLHELISDIYKPLIGSTASAKAILSILKAKKQIMNINRLREEFLNNIMI
jgi:hypothetical protein